MRISGDTTVGALCGEPALEKVKDLIFTNMDGEKWNSALSEYGMEKTGIIHAMEYLAGRCTDEDFVLPLYTAEERAADPEKEKVLLLNYAVHPGRPYIMIVPGGGYNREWMLVEGYPLADEINRLGYNAFILVYRTGRWGLFPAPLEDLARAVSFIEEKKEVLRVDTREYALTGASAGGHLISQWGTKKNGYASFGLAKPGALLMTYPAAVISGFYRSCKDAAEAGDAAAAQAQSPFLMRIGGEHFSAEDIGTYSLETGIDGDYPDTFLIHCKDDPVVPVANSGATAELLEKYGIRHTVRIAEKGGHSFGLGVGTDAEGWIPEAIRFWREGKENAPAEVSREWDVQSI